MDDIVLNDNASFDIKINNGPDVITVTVEKSVTTVQTESDGTINDPGNSSLADLVADINDALANGKIGMVVEDLTDRIVADYEGRQGV